jgi:hypothetical protein
MGADANGGAKVGRLEWCAGRTQGREGERQRGALTATARNSHGPNEDRAGHWSLVRKLGVSGQRGQPHKTRALTSW